MATIAVGVQLGRDADEATVFFGVKTTQASEGFSAMLALWAMRPKAGRCSLGQLDRAGAQWIDGAVAAGRSDWLTSSTTWPLYQSATGVGRAQRRLISMPRMSLAGVEVVHHLHVLPLRTARRGRCR